MLGEVIGRVASAALRIEDPRISEAHAMVSLHGAELKLPAFRGRLSVDGRPDNAAKLVPGARLMLAGFFALTVVEVTLPDEVFVLELTASDGEALGRCPIEGVMSFHVEPTPRLTPRVDPSAAAIVWTHERSVWARVNSGDAPGLGALGRERALRRGAVEPRGGGAGAPGGRAAGPRRGV